ncbi:MAG: winged helix-turn-helix transcriptional regulator [Saprospiraceae bacterium]|nr:winged helix-turn-helix transcriptional regulator [Saprospiraceae bacterium]MBK9584278.1 winged helix-turn-helix transcriptional regulator [Saprospiraceae bacterium]MBP6539997.1 winged helix-turn-helix transcriptional regulator [Saprospiraceae bacterium]MBP8213509.1 winged helix-turn-helix transcriptional regulator [Saprospiraceae bacterium]MBP9055336.1 winged helix-turn-helix transcriptional regulator [Saprospiraceae bacterium]
MGASKTDHFSILHNQMASIAKALGHPARIAIVEFLAKSDACICTDIVDILPLSQPTVSQHLKELKSAGIIQGTVEGNAICYCLNQEVLSMLKEFIGKLANFKNCC